MNPIPPLYKPGTAAAPAASTTKAAIPPHVSTAQNAAASAAAPANKPVVTTEGVMQRLKYFENLAGQYEHYIGTLKAALGRTGHAVPTAYFASLTGEAGSYVPNA
jgi:hypothetical protein